MMMGTVPCLRVEESRCRGEIKDRHVSNDRVNRFLFIYFAIREHIRMRIGLQSAICAVTRGVWWPDVAACGLVPTLIA